ncbi:MAG: hypothetical protein K5882_00585 [Bacteroidales bacterium]|nr:hypothetical protein [Bacteroidales bacterium]
MIDNLINGIEQAMLGVLDNEQLGQLRKVLATDFGQITEKFLAKLPKNFWPNYRAKVKMIIFAADNQ